jgi:hypothetical protein
VLHFVRELRRPCTFFIPALKDVDARAERGHDDASLSSFHKLHTSSIFNAAIVLRVVTQPVIARMPEILVGG